jgi:ribosomal protein S8
MVFVKQVDKMTTEIAKIISEINRGCGTNSTLFVAKRSEGALKVCSILAKSGFLSYYAAEGNRLKISPMYTHNRTLDSIHVISKYGRRV